MRNRLSLRVIAFIVSVFATSCGDLKVCKATNDDDQVGRVQTILVDGEIVTVPAGPAPGGTCKLLENNHWVWETFDVEEVLSSDQRVIDLVVVPSDREVTREPNQRSVKVRPRNGVTEIVFTNAVRSTGFVEICRGPGLETEYEFFLDTPTPSEIGVPAGACSPAIEVPRGELTISHVGPGAPALCETLPSDRLVSCDSPGGTATVKIVGGGIADQTIILFDGP